MGVCMHVCTSLMSFGIFSSSAIIFRTHRSDSSSILHTRIILSAPAVIMLLPLKRQKLMHGLLLSQKSAVNSVNFSKPTVTSSLKMYKWTDGPIVTAHIGLVVVDKATAKGNSLPMSRNCSLVCPKRALDFVRSCSDTVVIKMPFGTPDLELPPPPTATTTNSEDCV